MPHNRLDTTDAILPAAALPVAATMGIVCAAEMRFAHNASELCALCQDWQPSAARTLWLAEPKVDGIRALWIGGRIGALMTREGNVLPAGGFAVDALRDLEAGFGKPMFLDGEIAHPDGFEATLASFRRGFADPALTVWLFDAVPLDVWACAGRTAPLDARRGALASLMLARGSRPSVGMLRSQVITGDQAEDAAAAAIARGLEGIALKDATSPYIRGRGANWRRIKSLATSDAQIVMLVASQRGPVAHCRLASTAAGYTFAVDLPGGKDAPLDGQGMVIEIAHNGMTSKGTPRHARFVRTTARRTI